MDHCLKLLDFLISAPTQRAWMANYQQLAEQPSRTVPRRCLLHLSRELARRSDAYTPGARQELFRLAREKGQP